jgi:hypothetical protein
VVSVYDGEGHRGKGKAVRSVYKRGRSSGERAWLCGQYNVVLCVIRPHKRGGGGWVRIRDLKAQSYSYLTKTF